MNGRTASARRSATPAAVSVGRTVRSRSWVSPVLPGEGELRDVEVAAREAGLGVGEVEVPHPHEQVVEAEGQRRRRAARGTGGPSGAASRRSGCPSSSCPVSRSVVSSRVTWSITSHAGQEAAGEDVLVDPGVAVARGEHPVVRHRDRLDGDPAAGREHPVDGAGSRCPRTRGRRPRSSPRDSTASYVAPVGAERAVVHQLDVDPVGEARPRRSAARRARAARPTA